MANVVEQVAGAIGGAVQTAIEEIADCVLPGGVKK